MADDKDTTTPLQDLVGMVSGEEGKSPSWPVLLFLVLGVVLVVSIFGIQLALSKRKAAKLIYDLKMKDEAREKALAEEKLAKSAEEREAAKKRAEELKKEIDALVVEMDKQKVHHTEVVKELSAVTSWDDIVVVDKRS